MFCSKCGASLPADTAFCQSCGNPVVRTAPLVAAPASPVVAPVVAASPYAGVGAITYATNVSYAGFWLRFVAYVVDGFIVGFGLLILFVPLFFLMGGMALLGSLQRDVEDHPDPAQMGAFFSVFLLLGALGLLGSWLYHAYLESGEKQATWGKQMLGVYVTDLSGRRVTFARASGRFFAKIVTGMIPLWLGFIMAGFTERRQALHDMIASCLVLRR